MIVSSSVYISLIIAWFAFILFWRQIKKRIGPLVYVLFIILAGLVFGVKTASSPSASLQTTSTAPVIENAGNIQLSPLMKFFDGHSGWELFGYVIAFSIAISSIVMIPAFLDELRDLLGKSKKRKLKS